MSEAMTVETIIEAYWQVQGYWTKIRFPLQRETGGWSDIDVLAYNPEDKTLIISESKVGGPKRDIFAYTNYSKQSIIDYLNGYLSFLDNIKLICQNGRVFNEFRPMVNLVVIQLVSNCYIDYDVKDNALRQIENIAKKQIPKNIDIQVNLDTTLDIICEIIKLEKKHPQGRRYGHPVIDIVREINRYMHPNIRDSFAGKKRNDEIRALLKNQLIESLK